jgi:hypothetical protein
MLIVPLLLLPIAFVGGLYLSARFVPRPPPTPRGRLAARVIDLLAGAAAALLALHVYLAVRTATADGVFEGFDVDTSVTYVLVDGLWQSSVLVALAIVVHALAPAGDD